MKRNKVKFIVLVGQIAFLVNSVISLLRYFEVKESSFLITFAAYGLAFVAWLIWFILLILKDNKYYAIGFNNIYYYYDQNILVDSKKLEIENLKDNKLKKISIDNTIEYRLIDNDYVSQQIGLIKLDDEKTLIIFYKPNYKLDYKESLRDILINDCMKNEETFIKIFGVKDLNEENVIYSEKKLDAVVIQNLENNYQTVNYSYSLFAPINDLNDSLIKCVPHWFVNKEYSVNTFDNLNEAKEFALELIDLINDERAD